MNKSGILNHKQKKCNNIFVINWICIILFLWWYNHGYVLLHLVSLSPDCQTFVWWTEVNWIPYIPVYFEICYIFICFFHVPIISTWLSTINITYNYIAFDRLSWLKNVYYLCDLSHILLFLPVLYTLPNLSFILYPVMSNIHSLILAIMMGEHIYLLTGYNYRCT